METKPRQGRKKVAAQHAPPHPENEGAKEPGAFTPGLFLSFLQKHFRNAPYFAAGLGVAGVAGPLRRDSITFT